MGELHFELQRRRHLFRGMRWHWRYVASNGNIIGSGQSSGYSRKIDCEHAVDLMKGSSDAPVRYLA